MKTNFSILCFVIITLGVINTSYSQEPYLGEIRMFAGNFAPRGWTLCLGQNLPINQNQALFSLLGTTYGGDGRTTFALPDLRGRVPIQVVNGTGLFSFLGSRGGVERSTLTTSHLPSHNHTVTVGINTDLGTQANPTGVLASHPGAFAEQSTPGVNFGTGLLNNTGSNQSINNMQPSIVINYIIALSGIYPSRN
tara:strand:+ start:11858 stop:12439 length:582 start_codon:yes stop_codon:yes gene_type:complete